MRKTGKLLSMSLVIIPLFLPWFNHNPKLTTGCWGIAFILELLLPIVMIIVATFKESKYSRFVGIIGSVLYLGVMILAIGLWNQKTNVLSGFKWGCSIKTYMWGYWVSLVCIILFLVVFIFSFRREHD